MKLVFTTLACPAWDMRTIAAKGREYGYDGLDFRGYMNQMDLTKLPEFTTRAAESLRILRDAGLEVVSFLSSAQVYAQPDKALDEVKANAELCGRFGATQVRVFGGAVPAGTPWDRAIDTAAQTLNRVGRVAAEHGVDVVFETHDGWTSSAHVRAVMERVEYPCVAVLWDVHHPWRVDHETPEQTWAGLGKWVRNTHWKDARIMPDGTHKLCLMGQGNLPLQACYEALNHGGYQGCLTFEWEKKWHPELEEPEVSLPQFVGFMKSLMAG